MTKAILLDRDGVINKKASKGDYIKSEEAFEWLPGAKEAIKVFKERGHLVLVISNQRGIARGLMTQEDVGEIHDSIQQDLGKIGARIDRFYYCPHDDKDNCSCRKPKTGLIEKALEEFHFEPKESFLVGDAETDIEMGKKMGLKTILVLSGQTKTKDEALYWNSRPDLILPDLSAVASVCPPLVKTMPAPR